MKKNNIMTKAEWKRAQLKKKIVATIVAVIGLIIFTSAFKTSVTSENNGLMFFGGLMITIVGAASFLLIEDERYGEYRRNAQN